MANQRRVPFCIIASAQSVHESYRGEYPVGTPVIILTIVIRENKKYKTFLKTFRICEEDWNNNLPFLQSVYSPQEIEEHRDDWKWLWDRNHLIEKEGTCRVRKMFGFIPYLTDFKSKDL